MPTRKSKAKANTLSPNKKGNNSNSSKSVSKINNGNKKAKSTSQQQQQGAVSNNMKFEMLIRNNHNNNNNNNRKQLECLHEGVIWVIHDFLDKKECQELIHFAEGSKEFEYTAHPASKYVAHRECFRMQRNNQEMASKLFQRLQQQCFRDNNSNNSNIVDILKTKVEPPFSSNAYVPVGLNPNIRLYKYTKGMSFGKHVDGSHQVDGLGKTEITVLVYLSECQGGATRFYPIHSPCKNKKKNRKSSSTISFLPKPGSILFHVHGDRCLEHEADIVQDGIKYVLRTDVVYNNEV